MGIDRISVTKVIENGVSFLSFSLEDLMNGTSKKCTFQEGIIPTIKTDEWQFSLSNEEYKRFDALLIPGISCTVNKDAFSEFEEKVEEESFEEEKNNYKEEQEVKEEEIKKDLTEISGNGINIGREYMPFTNKRKTRKGNPGLHKKYGVIEGVDTNNFMSIDFHLKNGLENFKNKEVLVKRNLYHAAVKATWIEKEKMFLFEPYAGNLSAYIFIRYEDFTSAYEPKKNLIDLNKIVGKYTRLIKTHNNIKIVEEILRKEKNEQELVKL